MKYIKFYILILFFCLFKQTSSQTLIINEVSNGPTGNQEYVEFVVVSNTTTYSCSSSTPPCIDIRGWIFDDNSGYHGTGGVASGAVRFSYDPTWACVPLGTIILIYNNSDRNPAIPPDDLSMLDGNCTIIAPINCSLFESNSTTPGAVACSYPSTGWTVGGNWLNTVLANTADCARIVNLSGCEVFSMCYGTNANANNLIWFSGTGGQTVYYFNNIDPTLQVNWSSGSASPSPGLQTPGAPNNSLNAAYIARFNNGCLPITTISVVATSVNAGCTCNGSATANASGSIGGYTYLWSDGQTGTTATGLCTGIYTVTATSLIGCSNSTTVEVTSASATSVTVNSSTVCSGQSTTLTASGATSYSWNTGATTSSIVVSPFTTTDYTVTGTNLGCTQSVVANVFVETLSSLSVNSPTICSGSTATLIPSGASSYTYSSGTNIISPTTTTTYTITGASISGCLASVISTVSIDVPPTILINSPTICSGNTATLIPSGASSYTYSSGTNIVSPIITTSYSVIGSSVAGCTNTAISTVSVNTTPTVSVNSGSICSGNSFTITPSGASSYTYSSGTNVMSPTTNTNYTVTGASAQGCLNTAISTVSVNITPTVSVSSGSICSGNSFTIIPSGANSYTYSSGTNVVSPTTNTSYTVTGTSAQGCTNTAISTVSVNTIPTVSVNSGSICSGNSFTLIPSGASTYTYSSGTNVVNPTTNTNYTVTGASAQGCTNTAISTVSVNTLPTVSVNSGSICSGNSFTIIPSGANSYTYSSGTNIVSPTTTTNYTVTGASAQGCTNTAISTVSVNTIPTVSVNSGSICSGNSFTIIPSGASSYTYSSGTNVVSPITNTNYTVTGASAQGCTNTAISTVTVNTIPTVSVNSGSICSGNSFTIIPSGASSYTYSSGTNVVNPITNTTFTVTGASSQGCTNTAISTVSVNITPAVSVNSSSICSGNSYTIIPSGASSYTYSSGSNVVSPTTNANYTVTGASAQGCLNTAISTVSVNITPTVSVSSGSICSGNSFTIIPSGASSYTYSSGTNVVSPITNTTYTVTGASAQGCTNTAISTVTVNTIPTVSVNSGSICSGNSFTIIPSGASSYTYSSGTNVVNPNTTTTYTVIGASVTGCTNIAVSTVSVNTTPTVSVNSGSICSGNSYTIIPSGASSYTYSSGTNVVSPTTNTNYTVTGSSAQGCTSTAISTVSVNTTPTVSVNSGSICSGNSFTIIPSGASSYTYSSGTNVVSPITNTTYTVAGASAQGCTNTAISSVSVNITPTVSVNSGSICSGNSYTILPSGASSYTYSSVTNVVNPNATTTYSVIGISIAGCTNTAISTVSVNAIPTVTVNSGIICSGKTFTMSPFGASTYTYSNGSAVVSPTATSTYSVTGTSVAGCTNTAISTVSVNAIPTVTVNSGVICSGKTFTMSPFGASTYTYSNGSAVVSPTITTTYSLTGTSVAGCTNTAISTVSVNSTPTISVNSGSICSGNSFTIMPSGALTYIYSSGSAVVSPTITTTYSVTGTSVAGCTNTVISTVSVNATPTISVNSGSICSGNSFIITPSGASTYTYSNGSAVVSPTITTTYSLTGTSVAGCTNTAISTVSVNATPTVSVNSPTICSGQSTTITATGATTYSWNTGVTLSSFIISLNSASNYTVTGTSSAGCTNTAVSNVFVNSTPTISINSPTICVGKSTTLTAVGATNYIWSTGSLSNSVTVSPNSTTTYTVLGISLGCTNTAVSSVLVNPNPIVNTNSTTICFGQTTTLTATGATSYIWSTGSNLNSLIVSPLTTTNYTVIGTSLGCTNTAVSNVIVNSLPIITINSSTICSGHNAILTATGSATYIWNTGSILNPLIVSPSSTTNYSVIGTSIDGCTNTAITNVLVNTSPQVNFNSTTTSGCAPLCVNFFDLSTISGSTINSWNWTFDNVNGSNSQNPYYCFNTPGSYSVSLNIVAVNGCSNTVTKNNMISVYQIPSADFTFEINDETALSLDVYFLNQSTDASTYNWNFGDLATSTQNNPIHTYSQAGVYTVTLIAISSHGCTSDTVRTFNINNIFTFYAPNTFSPNEDNLNDKFLPIGNGWKIETYELNIFDRWGMLCFSTKDINQGWDGRSNNGSEISQMDTYTWKVVVDDVFENKHHFIGKVILIK